MRSTKFPDSGSFLNLKVTSDEVNCDEYITKHVDFVVRRHIVTTLKRKKVSTLHI